MWTGIPGGTLSLRTALGGGIDSDVGRKALKAGVLTKAIVVLVVGGDKALKSSETFYMEVPRTPPYISRVRHGATAFEWGFPKPVIKENERTVRRERGYQ
jgi:hypothetical protein